MAADRPLEGLEILLLEDDLFISATLSERLSLAGASQVEAKSTVADAALSISETRFDVAILDIALPDDDSRETAARLTEDGVPIVFHSGHSPPDWVAARFPKAQFLQKPSGSEALIAAITSAMRAA